MTSTENGSSRRISPADVQDVRFDRGTMLRPGYSEDQVDRFLNRLGEELARLHAEKAELRDRVHALQAQVEGAAEAPLPPSEQAVRLLATAQQTADAYVAEAEDFSRQVTADARAQHEEQLRHARETAGAIIQAAQEAATRMTAEAGPAAAPSGLTPQELEDQVAYLKAFAQACRVQLRSYLEALLTDVENEWGRADPGALPQPPGRAPNRPAPAANVARELPPDDGTGPMPAIEAGSQAEAGTGQDAEALAHRG
ncbi:DivIVA domain-containing protein [Blastococcus sp. TF02A-30]|uniref:DivIVA domain-containing protein n=1 Tax=Blastococcus sp. TF02A-30 TaxID=2250580 RepID=UPI000DE8F5A9|nr:DivIVA domain-containing protein [Blastococcus sp. TF02A-30]RBY89491.1 cell division protein DivIVA [Blastococcus sp. TF02A-30]